MLNVKKRKLNEQTMNKAVLYWKTAANKKRTAPTLTSLSKWWIYTWTKTRYIRDKIFLTVEM